MGKHVDAPPSPDYAGAAKAQGAANVDAARLGAKMGNPNVISPYGNQTVTYDGDIPTVTQTLTPVGQQTVDLQQQAGLGLANVANEQTQKIGDILGSPFSFGGTPQTSLDLSQVAKSPINAGTTAQDAIMARLEPYLQRQRTSRETQLINQGLRPGGEAYDNATKDLGQQENDLLLQAGKEGLGLDLAANQQGFNQALQSGQFGNTAINQQLAQALQMRDSPINEITALMSGSQVQNPQFQPYHGQAVAPAPLFQGTQAQGQWDMQRYQQEVAQRNALMNGLFSLGGSVTGGLFGLGG